MYLIIIMLLIPVIAGILAAMLPNKNGENNGSDR